jgi:undecaprenyl-diphosphatase
MSLFEAIVLGLVQGITEFLPISSTAHLRIIPALLKLIDPNHSWDDPGAAASAVIQLGTLAAVLVYFRHDIWVITSAFIRSLARRAPLATHESRLAWYIGAGTIPIVVGGLVFKEFITTQARSLWIMSASLIGLAILLWIAERVSSRHRQLTQVGLTDSLVVGAAQAVALIPGSSRSGTTITAGLFLGLTREAAARFSFLLSIPAVALSGLYELYEIRQELTAAASASLIVAAAIAAVSGFLAIEFLLRYLRTHTTYLFIWYRVLLGVLLLVLLQQGLVH